MSEGERFTFYAAKHHLAHVGDLAAGDEFDAALQLFTAGLRRHEAPANKSATHLERNRYTVSGEVVFRGKRGIVVDFGVPAGCPLELLSECDLLPGDAVRGEVLLAWLDDWPPTYERAYEEQWIDVDLPSAPPLTRRWQVERIRLQTTPWKELSPGVFARDWEAGRTWAEIERTNSATDDPRRAEYFLECRLVPVFD